MKKGLIILCSIFLLTGCGGTKAAQKKAFVNSATAYYETYGKDYQITSYQVSLGQLRQAIKDLKQTYDLKLLADCNDTSSVTFTLDHKKIIDTTINLNCK